MPRTPKKRASSTSSSDDTKPYRKPQTPKSPKGQGQKSVPKKWTEEDKEKLLFSICESKGIDWEGICAKFPDRTASQVSMLTRVL